MASVDANWSATNVPRMRTNRARSSITIQQLHAIESTGGKAGISSLILGRSRGLGARIRLERKLIRARYRGSEGLLSAKSGLFGGSAHSISDVMMTPFMK